MTEFIWNNKKQVLVSVEGTELTNNPETGQLWQSEEEALAYAQAEAEFQAEQEVSEITYAAYVVFEPAKVATDSGVILQAPNPEAEFSETTVTLGSTLQLTAKLLTDKDNPESLLTDMPKDLFRIPVVNQATGEQDLFAGILANGIISVNAPMTKAGYWEINEELINSKLADDFRLGLDKTVFAVVNVDAAIVETLNAETVNTETLNINEPLDADKLISKEELANSFENHSVESDVAEGGDTQKVLATATKTSTLSSSVQSLLTKLKPGSDVKNTNEVTGV